MTFLYYLFIYLDYWVLNTSYAYKYVDIYIHIHVDQIDLLHSHSPSGCYKQTLVSVRCHRLPVCWFPMIIACHLPLFPIHRAITLCVFWKLETQLIRQKILSHTWIISLLAFSPSYSAMNKYWMLLRNIFTILWRKKRNGKKTERKKKEKTKWESASERKKNARVIVES